MHITLIACQLLKGILDSQRGAAVPESGIGCQYQDGLFIIHTGLFNRCIGGELISQKIEQKLQSGFSGVFFVLQAVAFPQELPGMVSLFRA